MNFNTQAFKKYRRPDCPFDNHPRGNAIGGTDILCGERDCTTCLGAFSGIPLTNVINKLLRLKE